MSKTSTLDGKSQRKTELRCFLLLTVLLAPVLSVVVIGGLGFALWIYQMFAGPPGPPL